MGQQALGYMVTGAAEGKGRHLWLALAAALLVAAGCSTAPGGDGPPGVGTVDPDPSGVSGAPSLAAPTELMLGDRATRAEVVAAAATALRDRYVFPDVGDEAASAIEDRLDTGDYATLEQGMAFAERLTDDLQKVTNDLHLRLMFLPWVPPGQIPQQPPNAPPPPDAALPHGLSRVDTIEDGVGPEPSRHPPLSNALLGPPGERCSMTWPHALSAGCPQFTAR